MSDKPSFERERRTLLRGIASGTVGIATAGLASDSAAARPSAGTILSERETPRRDRETRQPSITGVEIASDHGGSPGEYTPVDTVHDDPFHVVFQVSNVNGGAYNAIVRRGTSTVTDVISDALEGSGSVEVWPEFNPCSFFSCWDSGQYTAVVTVTDAVAEAADTATTTFRIA